MIFNSMVYRPGRAISYGYFPAARVLPVLCVHRVQKNIVPSAWHVLRKAQNCPFSLEISPKYLTVPSQDFKTFYQLHESFLNKRKSNKSSDIF